MKILIVAVHFEVTGARYITDAFKRLGHDVKHVGANARLKSVWGVSVPEKYIWTPEEVLITDDWKPDIIILADTIVRPEDINLNIPPHVPFIYWIQDNHVRNVRTDGIDHYFLAHKHGQAQPVTHDDETWLPCAADTSAFTPSPIAWDDREYDVAMVGVMYPKRAEVIEALKAAGLKVYASTGDVYDEYRAIYHNARISLCLSANDDLAQRVFETGAMGCLIAMDVPADIRDVAAATELGIFGYVALHDTQQAVAKIQEMLTVEKDLAQMGAEEWQRRVIAKHDWTHRAQVVVDWYEREYGVSNLLEHGINVADEFAKVVTPEVSEKFKKLASEIMRDDLKRKPYLNLGCGKTHLPGAVPAGHEAVEKSIYEYPLWVNVDKVEGVGADKVFDLFQYPWPLADNSYDGALLAHICEHIPHGIDFNVSTLEDRDRFYQLKSVQDGWYAFFGELYRVLTPGAIAHIVSPYGFSDGGITDPSHTRYLTANTFTHSMKPANDGATFQYNNGGVNFDIDGDVLYRFTPMAELLQQRTGFDLPMLMNVYNNVCYDMYVRLKVVK